MLDFIRSEEQAIIEAHPLAPAALKSEKERLFRAATSNILLELGLNLTKTTVVCLSATKISFLGLGFGLAVTTIFNASLHLLEKSFEYDLTCAKGSKDKPLRKTIGFRVLTKISRLAVSGVYDYLTFNTLIHELGHAIAGRILLNDTLPRIVIRLPFRAQTIFTYPTLTDLTRKIGKRATLTIVSAAGTISATLLNVTQLIAARPLKRVSCLIKDNLQTAAVISIAGHALYAFSALWSTHVSNDFFWIWRAGGIHPLISVLAIVALPAIWEGGYRFINRSKSNPEVTDTASIALTPTPKPI